LDTKIEFGQSGEVRSDVRRSRSHREKLSKRITCFLVCRYDLRWESATKCSERHGGRVDTSLTIVLRLCLSSNQMFLSGPFILDIGSLPLGLLQSRNRSTAWFGGHSPHGRTFGALGDMTSTTDSTSGQKTIQVPHFADTAVVRGSTVPTSWFAGGASVIEM